MVSTSAAAFLLPLQSVTSTSLCQIAPPRSRRALRQSRGESANSGLRLSVEDDLLQAGVLPTTQGDNSRIHWSLSQEFQHVLSSDIRPYNKKSLGTSPSLQQETTLPVNFMFRSSSSSAPGFQAGVRLLQGGRKPSTVRSYDQKWSKFETFTTQVQDDAEAPRMSVLPASSQTVVAYLGFLLESDTISAKSLQSYLSAMIPSTTFGCVSTSLLSLPSSSALTLAFS